MPHRTFTLEEIKAVRATLVFFESPQRLAESLAAMAQVLGPRDAAVARELTKFHEEVRRGSLAELAARYAFGPTRVQFQNKDPRGFDEFRQLLARNSALGSANTQLGVQKERPSLYELVDKMKKLTIPTLVIMGDEDWPCLLPGILMKQNIPTAALSVIPNSGHVINIEEPDEFNHIVGGFLAQVDSGRWPTRDPRAC